MMAHTYTSLLNHVVFSTKERLPLITKEFEPKLHAYMGGIVRELRGKAYTIGGTKDHVHLLIGLPPSIALSDAVRTIKTNSSRLVHDLEPKYKKFAWQIGYGASSVSKSVVSDVVKYIQNQEEHHNRFTFKQEFVSLLKKHEIEYDERYIWD